MTRPTAQEVIAKVFTNSFDKSQRDNPHISETAREIRNATDLQQVVDILRDKDFRDEQIERLLHRVPVNDKEKHELKQALKQERKQERRGLKEQINMNPNITHVLGNSGNTDRILGTEGVQHILGGPKFR